MKKKMRFKIALCLGLIGGVVLPTAIACSKESGKKSTYTFEFNETLTAELEQIYDPQIEVDNGAKVVEVVLRNDVGVEIALGEDYTFTPTAFGDYYYSVVVEYNGVRKTYLKTVSVVNKSAPTITQMPQEKTVPVGLYAGFEKDLEDVLFTTKDTSMAAYVTKKVVSITANGKTEENPDGFTEYLLKTVGKYTVKVAVSDTAGNTSYSTYTLVVEDKTAPQIQAFGTYYAWLDESGKVTLPTASIVELSSYDSTVTVKKDSQILPQDNGKVSAAVGDELTLVYTAKDAYENEATATATLKVLETGKLFDGADADVATLFQTGEGILEAANGGVSYLSDSNADTLEWREGAYTFGDASAFSGIAFTVKNYGEATLNALVAAKVGEEKVYVGNIPMKSAAEANGAVTYVLDITKYDLHEIDGWSLELQSGASLRLDLTGAEFTQFASPYFEVNGLTKQYKIGETLAYDELLFHGDEISEYTVAVSGTNLGAGERYTFTKEGTFAVTFTVDVGNKTFTTSETVSVTGTALTVRLDKAFTAGTVGTKYTLPTATLSDTTKTLQTSVWQGDTQIALTANAFTPQTSGTYTVKYAVNGDVIDSYEFAVESANALDFEKAAAFDYKTTYGSGFVKNNDARYVSSGLTSAKTEVSAYGMSGATLKTPLALTADCNVATASVYANTAGYAQVALTIGETRYASDSVWLNAGMNKIAFRIDGKTGEKVSGVYVHNNAQYDNIFFLDEIVCAKTTALTAVFPATAQSYEAEQGTTFVMPNLLQCDASFISTLSLTMTGGDLTEAVSCYVGERLNVSDYAIGTYTITYQATDVFGKTHETSVTLQVTAAKLTGTIALGDYFVGEAVFLPAPVLQSEVYDADELATAAVAKYYRAAGGLEWRKVSDDLTFETTGDVEVKYVVTLGDRKISLYQSTYVHAQGVHFDYEKYSEGEHMGWDLSYSHNRGNDAYITDAWSHSGSYSAHITAHVGYNDTNGIIFGDRTYEYDEATETGKYVYTPCAPIPLGFTADTVVFWAYSEADRMTTTVDIDNYDWKWANGEFNLKKGAHKYVVKLSREIDSYTRFLFTVKKNESFYIDDVSFVKSGTPVFPEMDGKQYFAGEPVEFALPTVLDASTIAFEEKDLKNMQRTLTVARGITTDEYVYGDEPIKLDFAKGTYDLTFTIKIGMFEYVSKQTITVRGVDCEFIEPRAVFEKGVEYEIAMPVVNEDGVTLAAYYRHEDETEWKALTVTGDKAKIKLTEEGSTLIKFTATKGNVTDEETYKVLVRGANTLFDFELDDETDETHFDIGVAQRQGYITDKWSHDGKYSWFVDTEGHDFGSFNYFTTYVSGTPNGSRTLDKEYDTVTMWIKTTKQLTDFKLEIFDSVYRWIESDKITIPAGIEAMYTFKMYKVDGDTRTPATFKTIYQFGFSVHYSYRDAFYIDSVQAHCTEINEPSLPKIAYTGDTITFDEVKISGLPDKISQSVAVKYKQAGEESYTTLTVKDGKYTLTATKEGTLEIVVELTIDGVTQTLTYTVDVLDASGDPAVPDMDWA